LIKENSMLNQKLLTFTALAALCAATTMVPAPAHAAGQQGMVVVRDAQTGELRAPTAAESQALRGNSAQQRKAASQRVESVGPGGSRKVHLGRSALVYSVAKRGADGKLAEECVSGADAAHAALHHPTPAKEPRHESE
jgi:hypothetical protein